MQGSQIVARIKYLAAVRGVSMETLYADCKISSSAVSQWKNGTTKPSFESIKRIADYLGATSEYLLFGSSDTNNTDETHKLRLPPIPKADTPKSGLRIRDNKNSPAPKEGEADISSRITEFFLSLPKDRLRGILLALGAPEELIAELDHQGRSE